MPRSNKAFTLIELSIVLVIIGLVIGGVLVGQDLIKGAGIRAQISTYSKINLAVNTFRLKYGELPGDFSNGVAFGLQTDDGNDDGIIFGQESDNVMDALYNANLIENVAFNNVVSPFRDSVGHSIAGFYDVGKNYITTSQADDNQNSPAAGASYSAEEAYQIDSKIDDGLPFAGDILLVGLIDDYSNSDGLYNGVNDDGLYTHFGGIDADCTSDLDYNNATATYPATGTARDCPIIYALGKI